VEKWEQIRNLYFNDRMTQRQISRTLGVSRPTVKRAISTSGGPRYERTAPYESLLDPFKDEIRHMVESTNGDIFATVIYDKLSSREGTLETPRYDGGYQTLYRYVRELKEQLRPKEAFLRIETPPGFDAQCDWGKVDLIISGSPLRVSLFALTLSYSRYKFARLFFLERQECFFTGHVESFSYFGGVPKQVTYDNLTTAVAKILKGRARTEQEAFVRFRGEFPFSSNFAAKRKANEKGKVENQIGYIRSHAFALDKEFDSIEDANAYLLGWLDKDAKRVHGTHKEVIWERFEREKPSLNPLPSTMPECCRIAHAKVNKFSFVPFDTNRYSVPTEYVYSDVIVKGYERRIVIIKGSKAIAEHERLRGRREEQINPYHFLSLLEKKSRAVDHAVVMKSFALDPVFYQLKDKLAEGSENPNREWIKVLRLTEKYEMQQVISAVRMADAYGVCDYASIKNLIHQQVTPTMIVDDEDCLINHPTLTDVMVESQPLSCYDSLLTGGGPINE
jgi:transposase